MTIKKHNVIKKLDQYTGINPITINGEEITANLNGSIRVSMLEEIQNSLPGWELSINNQNNGIALVIKQKKSQYQYHMFDATDAMHEAILKRVFTMKPLFMHSAVTDPAFHLNKRRGF